MPKWALTSKDAEEIFNKNLHGVTYYNIVLNDTFKMNGTHIDSLTNPTSFKPFDDQQVLIWIWWVYLH